MFCFPNDATIILPGDSDHRGSCLTQVAYFWSQIKRHKMFFVFYILQSDMGFGFTS